MWRDERLFATAVMGKDPKKDASWFPLVVDDEERFYAAGKDSRGQFMRREGRPSEEAILTCRVIDRTLRPLFDQRIRNDTSCRYGAFDDEERSRHSRRNRGIISHYGTSDIPWAGPGWSCPRVKIKKESFC